MSTTLVAPMPFELPSALGFTISGNFMSGDRRSRGDSISWNFGVRMSCCSSTFLASALSRAIARVALSEPVYGTPSSSHSAGTWASRLRPSTPSAMLKIRSTSASASTRGRSGVASRCTTMWPWRASALAMAMMVSGGSHSASSSPSWSRFTL